MPKSKTINKVNPVEFNSALESIFPIIKKPKIKIVFQPSCKNDSLINSLIRFYKQYCLSMEINLIFDSEKDLNNYRIFVDSSIPNSNNMFLKFNLTNNPLKKDYDLTVLNLLNMNKYGDAISAFDLLPHSPNTIIITPKSFLIDPTFSDLRDKMSSLNIFKIRDYGTIIIKGKKSEIITIELNKELNSGDVIIDSKILNGQIPPLGEVKLKMGGPWLLYPNLEFEKYLSQLINLNLELQETNNLSPIRLEESGIVVLNNKCIGKRLNLKNTYYCSRESLPGSLLKVLDSKQQIIIAKRCAKRFYFHKLPPGCIADQTSIMLKVNPKDLDRAIITLNSIEFQKFLSIITNHTRFNIDLEQVIRNLTHLR